MIISKPQQYFIFNSNQEITPIASLPAETISKIARIFKITQTSLSLDSWNNNIGDAFVNLEPNKIYQINSKTVGYEIPGAVDPTGYIKPA